MHKSLFKCEQSIPSYNILYSIGLTLYYSARYVFPKLKLQNMKSWLSVLLQVYAKSVIKEKNKNIKCRCNNDNYNNNKKYDELLQLLLNYSIRYYYYYYVLFLFIAAANNIFSN